MPKEKNIIKRSKKMSEQRTGLHCPNCKSHNISISTESSVSGGVTAHHGAVSTTRFSNTHRNFWFCADCGTKFRNIPNLEEEIKKNKSSHIFLFVLAGIAAALFFYLYNQMSGSALGGIVFAPITFGTAFAAIGFLIGGFVAMNNQKKRVKELEYLKFHCFN